MDRAAADRRGSVQQWWRENLADPKSATAWLQSINADKASEFIKTFGGQLLHRLSCSSLR